MIEKTSQSEWPLDAKAEGPVFLMLDLQWTTDGKESDGSADAIETSYSNIGIKKNIRVKTLRVWH